MVRTYMNIVYLTGRTVKHIISEIARKTKKVFVNYLLVIIGSADIYIYVYFFNLEVKYNVYSKFKS